MRELWKDQRPLRLISVSLTNLTREEAAQQMSLFGESSQANRERDLRMDKAVDALRSKYGSDIIQRGTVLSHGIDVARRFKGQQDSEGEETK